MKHINIPIFIPHMGCPNLCVFCNQRTISGTCLFDEEKVGEIIETALSSSDGAKVEIAYFGGSFTGIDRNLMIRLLDVAQSYVDSGRVIGIRMSTRPDYIDEEIVKILSNYTVSRVELGIQSMSDSVLVSSKRGHSAECTEKAVSLLAENGFEVVGQMMIGLPSSELGDEIRTAEKICKMGCVESRIYPTVVFKDTELCSMMKEGEYSPLSLEEAVARSAAVLDVFDRCGVRCLRVGLCDSENLHSEKTYAAGPNHSALGELVMSKLFLERIENEIKKTGKNTEGNILTVECPVGAISKISGNKKLNKSKISQEYGIKKLKIVENPKLLGYNIKIKLEV